MKTAIIMRGLPGAGKSNWLENFIKALPEDLANITQSKGYFSTDNYFMHDGQYKFDENKIADHHNKNLQAFTQAAAENIPIIVCDNTNMQSWEYEPYVKAAKDNSYDVEIVVIGDPENEEHQLECSQRNIHNVPLSQIQIMAKNFQK